MNQNTININNKQVPNLRFNGFDDVWERCKLGDIVQITMGQSPDGSTYLDAPSGYILVQGNADLQNGWVVPRVWTTQVTKKAEIGDLIMSVRAPAGAMGKTAYNVIIGRGVAAIKGNEFIFQTLVKMDANEYWKKLSAGSTFESLNSDSIINAKIAVPLPTEQQKIGRLFFLLDETIAQHQRKYECLKKIKTALLQKMFPQNNLIAMPELRYNSFSNSWEQRKLRNETIEMIAGGDVDKYLLNENGNYPVIANALTNDGIIGYYLNKYRIKAPAVTITGRGDVGHAKARTINFTPVVRLLSIRSKHDIFFLENAINIMNIVIESTGVPQLIVPQLAQYEICFPPTISEENVIGSFFKNLDSLIALHGCKCKNIKILC